MTLQPRPSPPSARHSPMRRRAAPARQRCPRAPCHARLSTGLSRRGIGGRRPPASRRATCAIRRATSCVTTESTASSAAACCSFTTESTASSCSNDDAVDSSLLVEDEPPLTQSPNLLQHAAVATASSCSTLRGSGRSPSSSLQNRISVDLLIPSTSASSRTVVIHRPSHRQKSSQ